jgi:hypothetical protein
MKTEGIRGRDWGESAALLVGLVVFFGLPNRYTIGGQALTLTIGTILLLTFVLSVFWTITGARKLTPAVMTMAAAILALIVIASMTKIVYLVIYHAETISGIRLFETAIAIWVSNVIVFAIAYHWIGEQEFVFPRSQHSVTPIVFLDFVFLSFTTATAFSATDTPPVTTRARMYMMLEAAISLTTIAIAAARAVNILS